MELNMYELMTISWGSNVDKLWEDMRTQYTVKVTLGYHIRLKQ